MNASTPKLRFLGLFFALLLTIPAAIAQQSSFSLSDEGWTVVGDAQGPSIIPNYDSTGGNPGGYCYAVDDATGAYWYWAAPDTFLGDKSASFGKLLRFDLKQNFLTNQSNRADIILEGNGVKIHYDTPYNPDTTWTHYDVLLDTFNWEKNYYGSNLPISKAEMQQILGSLTKLWIRGEFRAGPDIGSIDNVILEPLASGVPNIRFAQPILDLFPNPCLSSITVTLKGDATYPIRVEISDAKGVKVYQSLIKDESMSRMDVSGMSRGIYFLTASDSNRKATIKMIKL